MPSSTAVLPSGSISLSVDAMAARSLVSGTRGATAWLKVVSDARSAGLRPSSSARLAAIRSASFRPTVEALMSSASTALTGTSDGSMTSTDCRTPLSRSSKSAAVRPPTYTLPLVTRTSTWTPSVPDTKRACSARTAADARIASTTSSLNQRTMSVTRAAALPAAARAPRGAPAGRRQAGRRRP